MYVHTYCLCPHIVGGQKREEGQGEEGIERGGGREVGRDGREGSGRGIERLERQTEGKRLLEIKEAGPAHLVKSLCSQLLNISLGVAPMQSAR